MLKYLERGHLSEPYQLVHQWGQEYCFYLRNDMIFSATSMAVHLMNSAWFCRNILVPIACSCAVPIVGG